MPHFLVEVCYSTDAVKTLVKNPQDRTDVVRKSVESVGGKLHSLYFALGETDVFLVVEMPNSKAAVAMGLAVASTGSVRSYKTTALITAREAAEAMETAKSVAYSPPK